MVGLNRQAARDEKAKIGEGAVGDPGMPLRQMLYLHVIHDRLESLLQIRIVPLLYFGDTLIENFRRLNLQM